MKNINANKYKNNVDLETEFNEALKNKEFEKLCIELKLPKEELMKYTSKLMKCINEKTNNNHIDDETFSFNEIPGFIYTPFIEDGMLNFKYEACTNKSKNLEEIEYLKNGYMFEVSKSVRNAKMSEIYTDNDDRKEVIKWLVKFIKEYKNKNAYKGLYLNGNFGSGKSYLISAMMNELAKNGYKVAMIYYPEFLRSLKASFKTDFDEEFEYARKADLLLLDDIGAENISSWSRDEILGPILQYRMDEKLPTFFTSNLSLDELEVHLSESKDKIDKLKAKRIIERIKFLTDNITLISENRRK